MWNVLSLQYFKHLSWTGFLLQKTFFQLTLLVLNLDEQIIEIMVRVQVCFLEKDTKLCGLSLIIVFVYECISYVTARIVEI